MIDVVLVRRGSSDISRIPRIICVFGNASRGLTSPNSDFDRSHHTTTQDRIQARFQFTALLFVYSGLVTLSVLFIWLTQPLFLRRFPHRDSANVRREEPFPSTRKLHKYYRE